MNDSLNVISYCFFIIRQYYWLNWTYIDRCIRIFQAISCKNRYYSTSFRNFSILNMLINTGNRCTRTWLSKYPFFCSNCTICSNNLFICYFINNSLGLFLCLNSQLPASRVTNSNGSSNCFWILKYAIMNNRCCSSRLKAMDFR